MGQYRATQNYSSNHNGRFFAFSEGDVTEVDDDVAAWVNRDSPGTLKPAGKNKAGAKPDSGDATSSTTEAPDTATGTSSTAAPTGDPLACPTEGCDFVGKNDRSLAAHQRAKGHGTEGG